MPSIQQENDKRPSEGSKGEREAEHVYRKD